MKTTWKLWSLVSITLALSLACGAKKDGFSGKTNEASGASSAPSADLSIPTTIGDRKAVDVLCTDGPKTLADLNKNDFSKQWSLLCSNGRPSPLFAELIQNAYKGSGEPNVKVIDKKVGELYVTDINIAYAMRVPLENPTLFADLKPHDAFASGINEGNSSLSLKVASRKPFPGKRSVEQVILEYDLTNADGAGIYDKRRTEFNTYPLIEDNRDITVSAENLLDAETNDSYHLAQGLLIGIRAGDDNSYLIFVNQLVVKNPIDPDRMERTLLTLNKGAVKNLAKLFKY